MTAVRHAARLASRAARMAPDRRRLHVEAVWELVRASVELAVGSEPAALRRLGEPVDPAITGSGPAVRDACAAARTVARLARALPWHPTCLRQALALQRMLRRRRIPAVVHLGVVDARTLEAHAWVTSGAEIVLGGRGVERFTTVAAYAHRGGAVR